MLPILIHINFILYHHQKPTCSSILIYFPSTSTPCAYSFTQDRWWTVNETHSFYIATFSLSILKCIPGVIDRGIKANPVTMFQSNYCHKTDIKTIRHSGSEYIYMQLFSLFLCVFCKWRGKVSLFKSRVAWSSLCRTWDLGKCFRMCWFVCRFMEVYCWGTDCIVSRRMGSTLTFFVIGHAYKSPIGGGLWNLGWCVFWEKYTFCIERKKEIKNCKF